MTIDNRSLRALAESVIEYTNAVSINPEATVERLNRAKNDRIEAIRIVAILNREEADEKRLREAVKSENQT